jgi:integrase
LSDADCRLREIQTLQWQFIADQGMELPDTKTGARRIPLPKAARAVLSALPRVDSNPFVIVGRIDGQHITDLQHPWRRIRKRAQLDNVRIHDLRHGPFADLFRENGLEVPISAKQCYQTTTLRNDYECRTDNWYQNG